MRKHLALGSISLWALVLLGVLTASGALLWMRGEEPMSGGADASAEPGGPLYREVPSRNAAGGRYLYLQNPSGGLLRTQPGAVVPETGGVAYPDGLAQERHVVRISRAAAAEAARGGGRLAVSLPSTGPYSIEFNREEHGENGNWTFVGNVETASGPQSAVLTFGSEGPFGLLPRPDGQLMQLVTQRGVSVLETLRPMFPIEPATGQPQADVLQVPLQGGEDGDAQAGTPALGQSAYQAPLSVTVPKATAAEMQPTAAGDEEVSIDVLGLYTHELAQLRGSEVAAQTEFTNYVAVANQAHIDSGSLARFRLVALRQVDYSASQSHDTMLNALAYNGIPGVDLVALRNEHRADLVAALRSPGGGIAYQPGNLRGTAAFNLNGSAGFSVSGPHPLGVAHEIGHNLGLSHDRETAFSSGGGASGYGAFEYSFGYRDRTAPAFHTIMAYPIPDVGSQQQVARFSTPLRNDCLERVCGIEGEAEAVRSINRTAEIVAMYRLPDNVLFIEDAAGMENDPGAYFVNMSFRVRLSTPAPSGGVTFQFATRDGTALAGEDYLAVHGTGTIAEGETLAYIPVDLLHDRILEPGEVFFVELSDVRGASLQRSESTGTINDDDPRATISGRLLFPEGETSLPAGRIQIVVCDDGSLTVCHTVYAAAPDFSYSAGVVPGAQPRLVLHPPSPWAAPDQRLDAVTSDVQHDIRMSKTVKISGRVRVPEGSPPLTSQIYVYAQGGRGAGSLTTPAGTASPPDYNYSINVLPGEPITLYTLLHPAPYVRSDTWVGAISEDSEHDIVLSPVPSVILQDVKRMEGSSGAFETWQVTARFSTTLANGVSFRLRTIDGTAHGGVDFTPIDGSMRYGFTNTSSSEISLQFSVRAGRAPERDEHFFLEMFDIEGAWPSKPHAKITILNDDAGQIRADVNGDGYGDLFWRDTAGGQLRTWLMNGNARIAVDTQAMGRRYQAVGMGDLNADGLKDLVWRDVGRRELVLWSGRPSGGYTSTALQVPEADAVLVAVGDINADGHDDLVWHNVQHQKVESWLMQGAHRVGLRQQAISPQFRVQRTGDYDGDGKLDLVWADTAFSHVWMWLARGESFEAAYVSAWPAGWSLAGVADVNGDGRSDLMWQHTGAQQLDTWLMDGVARSEVRSRTLGHEYRFAAAVDLNGDGRDDPLWLDTTRQALWTWMSAGAGEATAIRLPDPPGLGWALVDPVPDYAGWRMPAVSFSDVNADGRGDLLWHSPSLHRFSWWLMNGASANTGGEQAIDSRYRVVARGDFNGDGRTDVIWEDMDRTMLWLWQARADGAGFTVHFISHYPPAGWVLVGAGDVDGDGFDDLVWHNRASGEVNWWLMEGAARVGVGAQAIPSQYELAGVGDLSGDGRADLLWRDEGRTEFWAWVAQDRGFVAQWISGWPAMPWELVAARDLDGDGRADLLWRNQVAGEVNWWRMDGALRWGVGAKAAGSRYTILDVLDTDGDGRADVVWGDADSTDLWLWQRHPGADDFTVGALGRGCMAPEWQSVGAPR